MAPEATRPLAAGRPGWRTFDRTTGIAALAGAASVAGFAPLYLFPLPIVALGVLAKLCHDAPTPARAAAIGWWFGLGFFLAGVSWVYVSLHNFGRMPAPLAGFATLLFCAFLALFPALAGYACTRAAKGAAVRLALLFPAAWTLTEWTRGWIFTGFSWLGMGYSQVPYSPLAGYAPVLGVFGLTFAMALTAGLIVLMLQRVRFVPAMLALLALWIAGYGLTFVRWTEPHGAPVRVALLQGNIPQDIKWTPEGLRATLETYARLTFESDAKLVVFPETALPLFLDQVPPEYLDRLAAHARRNGGDVLIGVPERLPTGEYFNSVISIGTSPSQVYRKTHLVPFGEFIPLRPVLGAIVGALAIPLQDFSRGSDHPKPLEVAGQRAALNICYEDAFGEEIIRQLPDATLLVNVSNVAWFGRSHAPAQHLQISQARSMETGRYMLRATNTGMTGIIDERGRVVKVAPQFETAAVTGDVPGHAGTTPYIRWGNHAIILLSFAVAALGLLLGRRTRSESR